MRVVSLMWLALSVPALAAPVTSTFDTTTEGWVLSGDVASAASWLGTDGQPAGSLRGIDAASGDTWEYVAPVKFRGDLSDLFGGTISYDLKISARDASPWKWPSVTIQTVGQELRAYFAAPTVNTWTSYSTRLNSSGGWTLSDGLTAATDQQIHSALTNVTALRIRGEFMTGTDNALLDNVMMIPEPAAAFTVGGASLLLLNRRRRMR